MLQDLRLDPAGIEAMLKSGPVAAVVSAAAEGVADDTRGQLDPDVDVVVDDYQTDRAASSVTIRDAAGRIWQARDGVLTRAAAGQGLEVTER